MTVTLTPLSFTLFDFEKHIYRRNYIKYEQCLIELCRYLDNSGPIEEVYEINEGGEHVKTKNGLHPLNSMMTLEQKVEIYNRLASCITAYLSDTTHTPSDEVLLHLIILKSRVANIFYLSSYENMDHILWNRDLLDNNFKLNVKTELDIKYLLACYTLNSHIHIDVETLLNAIPYWGMCWYLGLLYNHHHSFNQQIETNFNALTDSYPLIESLKLDVTTVELICSPWMSCSYWDTNDRHSIKKSINVALEAWIKTQVSPALSNNINHYVANTCEIKRIAVLSEKYTSNHAMYRCLHKSLISLKDKYELILVSDPSEYDALSARDFDNIINIQDTAENLSATIAAIADLKPDLILYPSIGMAKWTIPLANMRLAKHQLMCYGHPASAMSSYIDFGAASTFPEHADIQRFALEKVTPFRDNYLYMEPHPEYQPLAIPKPNDGVVRIAVNSSLPKISSRFINLCSLVLTHSSVPVEFHFFLVESNSAFEKSIKIRLGSRCVIHPPQPYNVYMEALAICDLAIGTFPFGGANSNIDLMLLGIPKIFYSEHCDLAAFSDYACLSKLKLPEMLMPTSEATLLANLIYLIHDSTERSRISKLITDQDPFNVYFNEQHLPNEHMLVKTIEWIKSE